MRHIKSILEQLRPAATGTAAAGCERSLRQKAAAVLQQALFRCRADKRCADKAWCSAVLSVEAENIDNLPATF